MSSKITTFEQLEVYKLARAFRIKVYALTKRLPADEKYNLVQQMRRAAVRVTNCIAEGFGRYHFQENIQFCRICRGSINELIDDFNACWDEGYIEEDTSEEYKNEAYHLIKVLNGYIASIKRVKAKYKVSDVQTPGWSDDLRIDEQ